MIETFKIGEEAKASKLMRILNSIRDQGQSALSLLEGERNSTMVEFDRRLSAVNARRQRVNRVSSPQISVKFTVSDFVDIEQVASTATVRADTNSVTLRERTVPSQAVIRTKSFTTDLGTAEAMNSTLDLYRVHVDGVGQTPTGQWDLELQVPINLTFLVFDIAAMPSQPEIQVQVSSDGVTYTSATQVSVNGYRANAWFDPIEVRYVRIIMAPTHPDDLTGQSYSFGLTAFAGAAVQFQLLSEVQSKVVTFGPRSFQVSLNVPVDPGLSFFVSLTPTGSTAPMVEYSPGDPIQIPGTTQNTATGVGFAGEIFSSSLPVNEGDLIRPTVPNGLLYQATNGGNLGVTEPAWPLVLNTNVVSGDVTLNSIPDGVINYTLPFGLLNSVYPTTLQVIQESTGDVLPLAPGLAPNDPNIASITKRYVTINDGVLVLVSPTLADDLSQTFKIVYVAGPELVDAQIKVVLSTLDRASTPVFRGLTLEEV